ncbi:proline dehydrogenase / 1-pyrroline-5-carboxylate dehydrogenase [Campylobacter corcagiensis]|uniref:Formate dehydrogenase accessory sulfurtransferase FdhD n=1 Tax=Campylobacter corcagiensis TaxID=1448857 RepID=A0A7M1LE07_9BACT|nr:formate dehydrogenase accessory sulfurtransferase FdhD [Campylobacter corcagiensis]QKF65309.1 proline dehydrogenase / 1-pyrroline-5-carboxylate dehydrogenase [Campylobacter corcagiensis]QOQ86561.1 formate dehydrogenase accessory sulfurtransferase FdhD [Campylobacter corcagiensis]
MISPTAKTSIVKFKDNLQKEVSDILVREVKYDLFVNSKFLISIMATPIDEKALIIGYLISEGIVANFKDISKFEFNLVDEFSINVEISAKINEENFAKLNSYGIIVSGCGSAKSLNLLPKDIKAKKFSGEVKFSKRLVLSRMATFYTECDLYEQTGCVHTAKLYTSDNEFYLGEDIAQHNTIDKALGKAILNGANLGNSFLMVSGRLSSEMVVKAIMHGVPLIVSRTAPTYLGVMVARSFNLGLCGFARGQNINVYSGELI